MHPGIPFGWVLTAGICALLLAAWALIAPRRYVEYVPKQASQQGFGHRLTTLLVTSGWPMLVLKLLLATLFLLIIIAGLYGTPIPALNFATVVTWNLWWTGLILSVFFLGSAWCAVCPWDTLATWMTRLNFVGRPNPNSGLNLRLPKSLRNVWPALLLLMGFTWLELGVGITTSPYATALLAILMFMLAIIFLVLFERKAFCRNFCPVGRTIGFYAQLAPVELRPINSDICASCTSLDCYHGNDQVESCPTHLVMGSLQQNTYCTSCSNCTRSCPYDNVAWRVRPVSREAVQDARPHWDEAWFMLVLLSLALFHGVTMVPFWEEWVRPLARILGDSGQLLWSFSLAMVVATGLPIGVYTLAVILVQRLNAGRIRFMTLFAGFAFVSLPLAFAYHLAHNLNHLLQESRGLAALFANPLGIDVQPLSMAAKHERMMSPLISQDILQAIQTVLIIFGFWIAMRVIRQRGGKLVPDSGWRLFPMVLFALLITGSQLWLLAQPMQMRF